MDERMVNTCPVESSIMETTSSVLIDGHDAEVPNSTPAVLKPPDIKTDQTTCSAEPIACMATNGSSRFSREISPDEFDDFAAAAIFRIAGIRVAEKKLVNVTAKISRRSVISLFLICMKGFVLHSAHR